MDWREELQYEAAQKLLQKKNPMKKNPMKTELFTPIEDARQAEHQEQLRRIEAEKAALERQLKPIPYTKEDIPEHYREGNFVTDENNRIGYLRDLNGFQPMFHPLQPDTQQAKASLYIEVRDTYHHLYRNEATR